MPRPSAADIAAPEFPPRLRWAGDAPGGMAELTAASPVLVHFFDFAQLNSRRALPYVLAWHERYANRGLTVIGVHTPRFPFSAEAEAVGAAAKRLEIRHPVAVDSGFDVWADYGCEGWPSLFLWGQGGALRWFHFGEGEYAATELAIQAELPDGEPLPEPLEPLRPSDTEGATVLAPTPEILPEDPEGPVALDYEAGGAWAVVEGAGPLGLELDGAALDPVAVEEAGLYELATHDRHESHSLALDPAEGQRIHAISFAAGVP